MSEKQNPSHKHPFWLIPHLWEHETDEDVQEPFFSPDNGISMSEDENNIIVEAALPGLKPEEIDVTYENGSLWIKGEKSETKEDIAKKYYKKSLSSYSYHVNLPTNVNENIDPEASYEDGMMKIAFPKSREGKTKKISIKKK